LANKLDNITLNAQVTLLKVRNWVSVTVRIRVSIKLGLAFVCVAYSARSGDSHFILLSHRTDCSNFFSR